MKTLVLGIGNLIRGDDAVGIRIAQELARQVNAADIDVKYVCSDGLNLLELIIGYDKLIVVDAIMIDGDKVGEVYRLKPQEIGASYFPPISAHHFNLGGTIEMGKQLFPNEIPREVIIYAVGAKSNDEITEQMSDKVQEAIPSVANLIMAELGQNPHV